MLKKIEIRVFANGDLDFPICPQNRSAQVRTSEVLNSTRNLNVQLELKLPA